MGPEEDGESEGARDDDGGSGSADEEPVLDMSTPLERVLRLMHSQLPVSSTIKLVKNLLLLQESGPKPIHVRAPVQGARRMPSVSQVLST